VTASLIMSNEVIDPVQATELALLVELEACWENLRCPASQPAEAPAGTSALNARQRAYEAFRVKLTAYNHCYKPAHVPEKLLNTPARLGVWCRAMRDLYLRVEQNRRAPCPVHILEKAYRRASSLAARVSRDGLCRPEAPRDIEAAARYLQTLSQWCEDQTEVAAVV
jgi:hypothetical protein